MPTNAVETIHLLGRDFSYEAIGRGVVVIGIGSVFLLRASPIFFKEVISPALAFFRALRGFFTKSWNAFEGAAWLGTAKGRIEDCIVDVARIKCTVARHEAIKRAEWAATAESRLMFDEDCRLTYANATSLAIMRLDSAAAMGMGWQNAITEMRRDMVLREMEAAARQKRDVEILFPIDTLGATSDARHFTLHLNAIPNGTPEGFGGWVGGFSYRDGTECGLAPVCPLGLKRPVALTV